MTKKELRAQMRHQNLSLDAEARRVASEEIFRRIERLEVFERAHCVGLYCALPDEPQTAGVFARWAMTKRLVVPRVEGQQIRFFDYNAATLCKGAFGIAEPGPAARSCDGSQIDLIVVPGTAFTRSGGRLGRGGGYYDKYLSQPECCAVKIGACYAHQLVDCLPAEPHDVGMDRVCTECE